MFAGSSSRRRQIVWDRFVPVRSAIDFDFARSQLTAAAGLRSTTKDRSEATTYQKLLRGLVNNNRDRILAFNNLRTLEVSSPSFTQDPNFTSLDIPSPMPSKPKRFAADWTLDAPGLADDFYLNLIDWGSSNILSVALDDTVYLRNGSDASISQLVTVDHVVGPVTSVSWAPDGQHIAVGMNNSHVQLWDTGCSRLLRTFRGIHGGSRVGSLAWNGSNILTTGGRDGSILNNDVRERSHAVQTYRGHKQEICGLRWSDSCPKQLASGDNDGLVHVWDRRKQDKCIFRLNEHVAGVRALAWCPLKDRLLATGGGERDGCIKFWNTQMGTCVKSVEVGSQVCALIWNKNKQEILSSYGVGEEQPTLWAYPAMTKKGHLVGHSQRVLFMTCSPDGSIVATAAGGMDETLRLWKVFPQEAATKVAFKDSYRVHISCRWGEGEQQIRFLLGQGAEEKG